MGDDYLSGVKFIEFVTITYIYFVIIDEYDVDCLFVYVFIIIVLAIVML